MKLYVCWTTKGGPAHSCGKAHDALRDAGHEFDVKHAFGSRMLPKWLNPPRRREVARLAGGDQTVPILVLDDGKVVSGSQKIVEWANATPPR